MRLFTGIGIPPDPIANIENLLARLRPLARARWSPPANLHITTKFIGSWPEARLGELEGALGALNSPGPIAIEISGFGFFPNARRPKVFYAGVHGGDALPELARLTDDALAALGCAREDRPYSPHLTLARLGDADARALVREVEAMASESVGSWQADRFHLYLSQVGGPHSKYTVLASWPLAKETVAATTWRTR